MYPEDQLIPQAGSASARFGDLAGRLTTPRGWGNVQITYSRDGINKTIHADLNADQFDQLSATLAGMKAEQTAQEEREKEAAWAAERARQAQAMGALRGSLG